MNASIRDLRSGGGPSTRAVEFELRSPGVPFAVSVRLTFVRERWLAVSSVVEPGAVTPGDAGPGAVTPGDAGSSAERRPLIGIGASPRAALEASLSPLGPRAVTVLMADTSLVAASLQLGSADRWS